LTWTKKNEFKKNGHFYDVVWRNNLKGGLIEFQCVSDVQETELFEKLDQYVSVNLANQNSDRPLKNWSKLVFGVYLLTNLSTEPIIQTPLFISAKLRYSYFDLLSQSHLFIETPPPNGEFA
jgi:hypothetical protein